MVVVVILSTSWIVMITGQSIVLWSRLHLITRNQRLLKFVLRLIIFDSIVLCVPTAAMTFATNATGNPAYAHGFEIIEKIQMTWFTVQEFFISGVYLWEIRKLMKVMFDTGKRKIMWQLVAMNVLLLTIDLILVLMEYLNLYEIEATFKTLVYSVKLKVEFAVLTKVVNLFTNRGDNSKIASGRSGVRTNNTNHENDLVTVDAEKGDITMKSVGGVQAADKLAGDSNSMSPIVRSTEIQVISRERSDHSSENTEYQHEPSEGRADWRSAY